MDTRYDVVIVGGGVTGCATALFLAREPGFDGTVLVVERDQTYENAPSAKASGGFRQQFSTPENIRISLFGVHFLKHLDQYLSIDGEAPDVGFRENGYLLLATESMLPVMLENNVLQRELGADVHFRASDELRARYPWLNTGGIAGGFLSDSNEGYIDPYSLLQAYGRKARSLGVEFVQDEALSVRSEGARVTGVTLAEGGDVACGVVVNAAGAYGAPEICASLGVELPIESRKRFTFVFECREPIRPTPLTITEVGVAFRSEGKGFISNVSPPPERDPVTKDTEIDYDLFDELLAEAIKLTGAWCCQLQHPRREPDHRAHPGVRELLPRGGLSGHGLQQSAEVGVAFRSEGKGFISNVSPPPERDPVTKDTEIDYDLFDELIWPVLALRVPAFEAIKLTGAWCCHYDYNTLDENLIIGRTPAYENFYLAAGFSGHGLQQSPAVGRALAELITFGEYRAIDLARFGYERVPAGEAIRETNCY